jgi:hypothetical protein
VSSGASVVHIDRAGYFKATDSVAVGVGQRPRHAAVRSEDLTLLFELQVIRDAAEDVGCCASAVLAVQRVVVAVDGDTQFHLTYFLTDRKTKGAKQNE